MDPNYLGLIEMGLTGAIVLGVAFWQLWTVRDAGKEPKDGAPTDDSARGSGHPEG